MRYDYSQPYVTKDEYLEVKGVNLDIELQDDDNNSNKVKRFIQDLTNFVLDHLVMEYGCNELNRQTHDFEDLAEFRRVRFHYGMLDQIEYVLNNGLIQLNSGINMETGAITDFSAVVIGPAALRQFRLAGFCNKQEKPICKRDLSPKDMPTIEELVLELGKKVDKVDGKGLSANDYTNADKMLVGENAKELNNKVDKEEGKKLTSNDFTNADKAKLDGIENGAQENKIEEICVNNEPLTISGKRVNIPMSGGGGTASLKYIKENGQTGNISDIETAVNTVRNNLESFISSMFTGDKAKKAIDADFADRATKDIDGNPIKTTYAKQSALDIVAALITALTNGNSVVDKARKDQDGNRIDTTYVKISNISNVLNDTSTDKPLSAAQGKALKDALDTLSNYIYNGAANTSIDRLAEVFAFLTGHDDDETLDGILAGKVSIADIVDNLTTNNASKAVSAKQAYILKGLIDELVSGKADDFSVSSSELEDIFTDPVEEEEENE